MAEKSIIDKQKLLREFGAFAVENIFDGVYLINKEANLIYVNKTACEQMGYSEEEMLAMTMFEINPHLTDEMWRAACSVTVNDKFQMIETEHRRKDGKMIPLEVIANLIEINGEQYGCSFTRDISERKEMEARIRQAEKMKAIGQLAGGIAHDFNNQLAGILGYADMLRRDLSDNAELTSYVQGIIAATQRSAGLMAQLLAFASKGKYQSVSIDIHKLINESLAMLRLSLNKNIKIITSFDAECAVAVGDPAQLENAILNLAINARDAMPAGGELKFSTSLADLDEKYCRESIFDIKPDCYIRIIVTDTGKGMDDETLDRIFEPFFSTKENGKGTGMGLASVYGTVKNHKGAVEVRSRLGRGTEVILYLPCMKNRMEDSDDSAELTMEEELLSANVLLVEDEELARDAVKMMLEGMDCRVFIASNGAEAVKIYKKLYKDIDLVLLDIIMPEMGGIEGFYSLRRINPSAEIILISGYSIDSDVQKILKEGAAGFLQKPFLYKELAAALAKVLGDRKR